MTLYRPHIVCRSNFFAGLMRFIHGWAFRNPSRVWLMATGSSTPQLLNSSTPQLLKCCGRFSETDLLYQSTCD